jgi:hypothetical protein
MTPREIERWRVAVDNRDRQEAGREEEGLHHLPELIWFAPLKRRTKKKLVSSPPVMRTSAFVSSKGATAVRSKRKQ